MPKPNRRTDDATAPTAAPRADRPVVHPEVEVKLFTAKRGNPLTAHDAIDILGLVEATREHGLFKDRVGKFWSTTKNVSNRMFTQADAETLMQTMLMRDAPDPAARRWWQFNGQPMIIDKYGMVQSAQHRLVALFLAEQERTGPNAEHWVRYWDGPVTIDTLVVYGTDDAQGVVNTQDTGRPQTYADTLYRGGHFASEPPKRRATLARALDYALRLLWQRAGGEADAFAPRRTHQGMDDFLRRHPTVVDAVKWCVEEDADGGVSKAAGGPGTAAGLLYLMAASYSDGEAYHAADRPDESAVNLSEPVTLGKDSAASTQSAYDRACEFWAMVAGAKQYPEFRGVREALGPYFQSPDGKDDYGLGAKPGARGTADEVLACCVKAWEAFVTGGSLTRKALRLTYTVNDDGERVLADDDKFLRFGGIDKGHPDEERVEEEGANGFSDAEPDEATQQRIAEERAKVDAEKAAKGAASRSGSAKGVSVVTGKPVKSADGQALDPLPSSRPKRAPAPKDKCPKAKDGKHVYLPKPGNRPGDKCSLCDAPNPDAGKAPKLRTGTGK